MRAFALDPRDLGAFLAPKGALHSTRICPRARRIPPSLGPVLRVFRPPFFSPSLRISLFSRKRGPASQSERPSDAWVCGGAEREKRRFSAAVVPTPRPLGPTATRPRPLGSGHHLSRGRQAAEGRLHTLPVRRNAESRSGCGVPLEVTPGAASGSRGGDWVPVSAPSHPSAPAAPGHRPV